MKKHVHALAVDDQFIGTASADKFWLHAGSNTVVGFDPLADRIGFDVGHAYNDIMFLGSLSDGMTFGNGYGTASFAVHAGDFNGDGIGDTRIEAFNADGLAVTVDILGVAPDQLHGWNLIGG